MQKISTNLFSSLFLLLFFLGAYAQPQLRPLTPDDLFGLEDIGQAAISPDGKWLAYVVKRAKSTAMIYNRPFLEGNDRADVWLVPTSGGKLRNLTNGLKTGSGWWAPTWAPDSRKLAVLSTHGDNVRLWVIDVASGKSKLLNQRGVDPWTSSFEWLDSNSLVFAVLPEGQKPNQMTVEMRAAEIAMKEWRKAWQGKEPTSSALESGISVPAEKRLQGELLLVDIEGRSRTFARAPAFREVRVAPGGNYVAALKQTSFVPPDPSKPLVPGRQPWVYDIAVFDRSGRQIITSASDISNVQPGTARWSPDGKQLAFIKGAYSPGASVSVCNMINRQCSTVKGRVEPSAITWAADGKPAVRAKSEAGRRHDWWLIDGTAEPRNITKSLKTVPSMLIRSGSREFFGLADGEVWKIDPDSAEVQNLTSALEPRIMSILTPGASDDAPAGDLLVSSRSETGGTLWHRISLSSGEVSPISKPHPDSLLADFDAQHDLIVIGARDRAGTYLWLLDLRSSQARGIYHGNQHLMNIAQTEFRKIEYRSTEGRELKGWILLPVGYEQDKRYPTVTIVYPGNIYGDNPPGGHARNINNHSALNFHLLAARGYAVLFPSIPLKAEGEPDEPLRQVPKAVLPAVEKAVEIGIADPKSLGVLGQSYGGYGVYALVASTDKFHAAVSLAGLSDLISLYGTIDVRFRYDANPHERFFMMALAEGGQLRMGNPPWKDAERYVRNSPIFIADKIETPLMIVQGDLDYVAIQQGEQMFSALHRQNKRAAFVRYWGEGHVLESPANIRDLWNRIFAWFDKYLES